MRAKMAEHQSIDNQSADQSADQSRSDEKDCPYFRKDRSERQPEDRMSNETALVDDHLYVFGGRDVLDYFPRNKIAVLNLRVAASKRQWVHHLAQGQTPPPCVGAQCVVMDKMIYSYGGQKKDGDQLDIIYRLDLKKIEWIEVATPIEGLKPPPRTNSCLCVIGSRMIMFGGKSIKIPSSQLQCWAAQDGGGWMNDIYEFEFEEGNEKGMWLNLEVSGTRPKPLRRAAMTPIGQHRAFLLGVDIKEESYSSVLNLQTKCWTVINFNVKLSSRRGHSICQLVIEGLEEKSLCLLTGGWSSSSFEDSVCILDMDEFKAYPMDTGKEFEGVSYHTSHCMQYEDKTTDVLVYHCHLKYFHLDSRNESFMKIEPELRLTAQLQQLRRKCAQLEKEVEEKKNVIAATRQEFEQIRTETRRLIEQEKPELALNYSDAVFSSIEVAAMRQKLISCQEECRQSVDEISSLREELKRNAKDLESNEEFISTLRRDLRDAQDKNNKLSSGLQRLEAERRNKEEMISPISRYFSNVQWYHVLLWISIVATIFTAIYYEYCRTPRLDTSPESPVSIHEASWNEFARIVCESGSMKWQNIGDHLKFDWRTLESLSESGGSKRLSSCRFLLEVYREKNGDSEEVRSEIIDACIAVHIGGLLQDEAEKRGFRL